MKRLLDLKASECRWPVPLEGPNSGHFCAKPTPRLGLPYCAEHMDAAYKRSFAHKLRIRPDFYNGASALPHHSLAA
jgi:hypothetical protein